MPKMNRTIYINPDAHTTSGILQGSEIQNQALQAERRGALEEAERLYLQAVDIKERGAGSTAATTATSRNSLGELYIKLGKLDDAEFNLRLALDVRSEVGPPFDAAVTRENLAQVWEMRGDAAKAKEIRMMGCPDSIACANYTCGGGLFSFKNLLQCTSCKATLYCSQECQAKDWRVRHKKYCKLATRKQGSA